MIESIEFKLLIIDKKHSEKFKMCIISLYMRVLDFYMRVLDIKTNFSLISKLI